MFGSLQALTLSALLLLNICLSSIALPINNGGSDTDNEIDPWVLIATGLLSQERRLQEIEQQLTETSTTQKAQPVTVNQFGRPLIRSRLSGTEAEIQQSLEERKKLNTSTRLEYLEEDVVDNRYYFNHNLNVVRDHSRENVRKESEDIRNLHNELVEDVQTLRDEMSYNHENVENDISTVDSKVEALQYEVSDNTDRLNNGFYLTTNYIRAVKFLLKDEIYELKQEVEDLRTRLVELEQPNDNQPNVGPVGDTGGVQSSNSAVEEAEKALQEWLDNEAQFSSFASSNKDETAIVESENKISLEELLHELMKYNM